MTRAASLVGRTCTVTGASSGIGLETARGLARLGGRVLLVCRDRTRGARAQSDIRRTTGQDDVELFVGDLGSQHVVRRLAGDILARHDRVHVLVNNAATITQTRSLTEDGIETQFAVNHLAPFLFTNLLLPAIKRAAPSRIVNVASQVERFGRINFADLQGAHGYDPVAAYCQSKLANVLFTYELARRLHGDRVTANCLHPGVIATKLLADYGGRPRIFTHLNRLRYPGPVEGAKTSISLASSPDLENVTGTFFMEGQPVLSSAASRDLELQASLWDTSVRLTTLAVPDCTDPNESGRI